MTTPKKTFKELLQPAADFWNNAPIQVQIGLVFLSIAVFAVILLGFIFPVFGLILLCFAGLAAIILSFIFVAAYISDYRYYR